MRRVWLPDESGEERRVDIVTEAGGGEDKNMWMVDSDRKEGREWNVKPEGRMMAKQILTLKDDIKLFNSISNGHE